MDLNMKVIVGLLLAVAVCSTVGLPARDPNSEAEYVTRKEEDFKDFAGVVDTGADLPSPFDGPDFGSSDSFFSGISDYMRRFRERVFGSWWNNIPTLDIGDLDPSKGNSTSEVKVIDGHRVEINNTVYTKTDPTGNAVYKVRVVNIRPLDEDGDTATVVPDTETDKDATEDNEVLGASESTTELHELPTTTTTETATVTSSLNEESDNIDTTTQEITAEVTTFPPVEDHHDDDNAETTTAKTIEKSSPLSKPINEFHEEDFESVEAFAKPAKSESVSEERFEKLEFQDSHSANKPISSSEEAYTSSFSAPQRAYLQNAVSKYPYTKPLETEFSEEDVDDDDFTAPELPSSKQGEWDSFENWHTNQDTNSVDDFQSVPVDLSNDIEVNQMLADQGAPTDPDAEVLPFNPFIFHYNPGLWNHQNRRPAAHGMHWADRRLIGHGLYRPIL